MIRRYVIIASEKTLALSRAQKCYQNPLFQV